MAKLSMNVFSLTGQARRDLIVGFQAGHAFGQVGIALSEHRETHTLTLETSDARTLAAQLIAEADKADGIASAKRPATL